MDKPKDADQRVAVMLMLSGGVHPADISRILNVHPAQIKKWLSEPHRSDGEDDDE